MQVVENPWNAAWRIEANSYLEREFIATYFRSAKR